MSLGSDLNGLRDGDKRDSTGTAIRDPAVAGALEADIEQSEHVPLTPEKTHNISTGDRELDHTYHDEEDYENEQPEDMGPLHVQPNTLLELYKKLHPEHADKIAMDDLFHPLGPPGNYNAENKWNNSTETGTIMHL